MTAREFYENIAKGNITEEMIKWAIERMDEVQKNKNKKIKKFRKNHLTKH